MSPRQVGLVFMLALVLIGCPPSAPTTGYEHLNDEIEAQLAEVGLGSGDVFEVRVYGEKELSGVHRISPDGAIDFPLVGRVAVAGKSPDQIGEALAGRLRDGYLKDPFVSVYVQEYNSKKIFVLGDVAKPGTFPYRGGMNVVEAITLAGGFKNTANANYVVVTRKTADGERTIPVPVEKISKGLAANLELQAGDIVFVPDKLL
jgi:protein involved in polysaccharide export with SLBB domain